MCSLFAEHSSYQISFEGSFFFLNYASVYMEAKEHDCPLSCCDLPDMGAGS